MTESLITPEALAMIGIESDKQSGVVHKKEFQRWAAAVDDLNPLYFDGDYARSHGYADVVMPPMFLRQVLQGVSPLSTLRPDGIPDITGDSIPLRAKRRMAGGEETEFLLPVYDGDEITATRKVIGIEEKEGRSGPMVLAFRETLYVNQHGQVVARSVTTSIAR